MSDRDRPLLVVGNECQGYLTVSPLFVEGPLRSERFQPFSLLNQPRDQSRFLREILAEEGSPRGAAWAASDGNTSATPSIRTGAMRSTCPRTSSMPSAKLAGRDDVVNATDLLMHPHHGLRTFCSPSDIAYFEYTNVPRLGGDAADALRGAGRHARQRSRHAGWLERRAPRLPHDARDRRQPRARPVRPHRRAGSARGSPGEQHLVLGQQHLPGGLGRCGPEDLPERARDYVEAFAGPYFEVMAEWFARLRLGTPGGELAALVAEKLPFDRFGIFLNAGHLIHLEEWVSSPIYPGSEVGCTRAWRCRWT